MPVSGPQAPTLFSGTETYSYNILGPSSFTLTKLDVAGSSAVPAALSQSKYIVALDEQFTVSVVITFDQSPLTSLLMCLGTDMKVDFGFEGFGKGATETDVDVTYITTEGQFAYLITYTGTPRKAGLTPGFYQLAATATIGPVTHKCGQHILGYGYIGEIRFQVY
ncbi:MAG: hypothetical protein HC772_02045 [Leptolyngbyaceae cyanobacterium CRU_2_3]|nr:hypothetical protein [Leptolyngbyaceae cyanobacterium CRU_2_3]